jgi:hypothetical protein
VLANGATVQPVVGPLGTAVNAGGSLAYVAGAKAVTLGAISGSGSSSDTVSFGAPAALADLSGATWMAWVYVPVGSTTGSTLLYKSDGNGSAGWMLYLTYNPSSLDYSINFKGVYSTTDTTLTSAGVPLIGKWTQIVVTSDGSSTCSNASAWSCAGIHMYVNGVETSYWFSQSGLGTHTSDTAQVLYLGLDGPGAAGPLSMAVDEVAVWRRGLSPAEVATLAGYQRCN